MYYYRHAIDYNIVDYTLKHLLIRSTIIAVASSAILVYFEHLSCRPTSSFIRYHFLGTKREETSSNWKEQSVFHFLFQTNR